MKEKRIDYGFFVLRALLGLMFFFAGLGKFLTVQRIGNADLATMIGNIGFPWPGIFAWILIFSEMVFGLLLLIGWKTKYTVWPLAFILLVAVLGVVIPGSLAGGALRVLGSTFFFHLIGITALILIFIRGPGDYALSRD